MTVVTNDEVSKALHEKSEWVFSKWPTKISVATQINPRHASTHCRVVSSDLVTNPSGSAAINSSAKVSKLQKKSCMRAIEMTHFVGT